MMEDEKHLSTVWEVHWINNLQKSTSIQKLMSISSDGKVNEWSLRKGLVCNELKLISFQPNPLLKKDKLSTNENFRFSSGYSLDSHIQDENIYFIGTEEGAIHKCSKSYKEQYLNSFYGHTGAVYKVRCNPFCPKVLLSASSDWTCQIWHIEDEKPKFILKSTDLTDEIITAEWSPFCSTLFACSAKGIDY